MRELSWLALDTQRRQVADVHGTLLMAGADRLGGGTGTPVVSQRSEAGQGILGSKAGRGKYDMWYDWVVKALVSSCMSVGRPLAERLDLPCLAITAVNILEAGGLTKPEKFIWERSKKILIFLEKKTFAESKP